MTTYFNHLSTTVYFLLGKWQLDPDFISGQILVCILACCTYLRTLSRSVISRQNLTRRSKVSFRREVCADRVGHLKMRGFWRRPITRTYEYNLEVGEHYYSPLTSYLDSRQGSRGETPGALTYSERLARKWIYGRRYDSSESRDRVRLKFSI
jgi:hypothetical protein